MNDSRRFSASAARNRGVIHDVLRTVLPSTGTVLEVASGTGEHVVHFAANSPDLVFQPSDPSPDALTSIAAWIADSGVENVEPPLFLDVVKDEWPVQNIAAVYCCNMIHIAPWEACVGLVSGAARLLAPGAALFFYGPFFRSGVEPASGNVGFDQDLRHRNRAWGIRHLDDVATLAKTAGFNTPIITEMPANNLCVTFYRA